MEGASSVYINSTSSLLADARSTPPSLQDIAARLDVFRKENLIVVVSPTDGQAERFREVLMEYDVPAIVVAAKDGENPPLSPFFKGGITFFPPFEKGGGGGVDLNSRPP